MSPLSIENECPPVYPPPRATRGLITGLRGGKRTEVARSLARSCIITRSEGESEQQQKKKGFVGLVQ